MDCILFFCVERAAFKNRKCKSQVLQVQYDTTASFGMNFTPKNQDFAYRPLFLIIRVRF